MPHVDHETVKWDHTAAELGLAEARFSLGSMLHADGDDVPQDNQTVNARPTFHCKDARRA